MLWLPVFGILMCAQMLMHMTAHGGCMDTVRESALGADSGREIPCHTWDSNPPRYCTWLSRWTPYKQSYSCPSKGFTCFCLLVVYFLVFVCVIWRGGGGYGQLFVLKHCQRVQKRCAYPPSICVEPGAKQMLLWYVGVPVHWQVIQLQQLQNMADEQVHASATVQDQTGARQNNNNNAHSSCTHQCNERSLDTY